MTDLLGIGPSYSPSYYSRYFNQNYRCNYYTPVATQRLIEFLNASIIISHGAWPFVSDAIALAIFYPNVYLSPDLYLGFPGSKPYVEAANFQLGDRILFGTCYPNVPYDFALSHFRNQEWKEGVLERILYRNGAELLGLPY